jgi:mono/diheme cytochrome c family protein
VHAQGEWRSHCEISPAPDGEKYPVVAVGGAAGSGERLPFRLRTLMKTAAAFVLTTSIPWALLIAWQPGAKNIWDGVYTKEQAQRGQPLYKQYCASCHGDMLEGIEMASPLAGGEFIDRWAGQTVGELFERVRATMPRDKPGRLSREINADITAFMLSFNQFPAGQTELSRDTQALSQIRIDPVKPR